LFGSWHLALSAYNVGENRVKRAVTKYYTRDFWALIKKRRSLPAETKQYVPKFIAAAMIAKNPEKYGFSGIEYDDPLSYDTVALNSPISLTKLANNLSVDVDEMRLLNPKFRSDFVPILRGSETVVRIPVGRGSDAQAALSLSVTTQPKVVISGDNYFYKSKRGDNLSTVAHKHHTTVSRLRRLNNLSNRTILRVGMRLKVPDPGGNAVGYVTENVAGTVTEEDAQTGPTKVSARRPAAVPALDRRDVDVHVVRRGDNLSSIAAKYGVSVGDLLKLNNLTSHSVIHRGQKLRLRADPVPKSANGKRSKTYALAQFKSKSANAKRRNSGRVAGREATTGRRRHIVRRGETLYDVSKKYGVALNRLAKANGRDISYRVMAGEQLLIPE
jgi:membrane-bound lytic murein transglycosylase D